MYSRLFYALVSFIHNNFSLCYTDHKQSIVKFKGGFFVAVVSYKCPNCGGELIFDPESQKMKCEYCISSFDQKEMEELTKQHTYDTPGKEIIEDDSDAAYYNVTGSAYLYTCPNCGAQVITDPNTSATTCYYCHNPISFTKQLSDEFKPSKVIPFQKSKDQALETFLHWCKRKKFLPDDFSSPRQLENIAGLYIPYWLVDCDTNGYLKGTGKKVHSWRQGDYRYTKTDIFSVSRAATMSFSYLPHDASSKAEDQIMESIAPFNYDDLKDFSYSYLSGFMSEKYDVTKEDVYPVIKARVEKAVEQELRSSITGYSSTSIAGTNVQVNRTRFHYTLMPVWMLTYQYKGKTYMFAMNGQTGKTFGNLPVSQQKLNILFFVVFLIAFAAILFVLLYMGGITL